MLSRGKHRTRAELYEAAKRVNIPGRSRMNREELARALTAKRRTGFSGAVSAAGRLVRRDPSGAAAVIAIALVALLSLTWATFLDGDGNSENDGEELLSAVRLSVGLVDAVGPWGSQYTIARPIGGAKVALHTSPGGAVAKRLGPRTEHGSPRTFFVAEYLGEWLGVVTPELPNGRLGWIRLNEDKLELVETAYSLRVDLSKRVLDIRYGERTVRSISVSIGRAGHDTPAGRFAVTDALAGAGLGPWYGCCAMALSGHQPNLPPGWVGGDRIAIHGTPGPVGEAESAGCLRATDRDMVTLFTLVPLGAPVFIRA